MQTVYSKKCIWNCYSQNGIHFIHVSIYKSNSLCSIYFCWVRVTNVKTWHSTPFENQCYVIAFINASWSILYQRIPNVLTHLIAKIMFLHVDLVLIKRCWLRRPLQHLFVGYKFNVGESISQSPTNKWTDAQRSTEQRMSDKEIAFLWKNHHIQIIGKYHLFIQYSSTNNIKYNTYKAINNIQTTSPYHSFIYKISIDLSQWNIHILF